MPWESGRGSEATIRRKLQGPVEPTGRLATELARETIDETNENIILNRRFS
jgi:hypothetical protein